MTMHVTDPLREMGDLAVLQPRPSLAARSGADRRHWLALVAVTLLGVSVFWLFEALPFQDLPAHAGLIALRNRYTESSFEARFFVLAPHIGPYSLFRFLGGLFARLIGPVGAVRALATLPMLATPCALLYARRRLMNDTSPLYGFLGVTLSFGFMTLLGFASYLLGAAVMLFGLVMWQELLVAADDQTADVQRREWRMAAFAPVIFVAHGHAFVLFLLCAGVSTLSVGLSRARWLRLRALLPAVALAGYVAWLERGSTTPLGSVPVVPPLVPVFHGFLGKLELLATPTLMTRSGIDLLVAVGLWGFAMACTLATLGALGTVAESTETTSREARHSRALLASAAAVFSLFLVLPHAVGWFGFVDGRLLPVAMMLALLGARRSTFPAVLSRIADVGLPLSSVALSLVALIASFLFQREASGYREVLAKVPSEATLLNLPLDPNSDVFTAHPFIHYDKLLLAERPVVVSDVWFHQGSALYPTAANPALRLPSSYSESDLKVVDWPSYHLEDWHYVLIRTRPGAARPYTPASLELAEHVGGWWLFRQKR
jgi:hypothetical protein